MAAFAVVVAVALLVGKGPRYAGAFAAGAALSVLNFHWLQRAVDALAGHFDPAAREPLAGTGGSHRRRRAIAAKFLLRYALIAAAGYVIFRTSVLSLGAFLGGLFVFVAGVLAEMVYELATGAGANS